MTRIKKLKIVFTSMHDRDIKCSFDVRLIENYLSTVNDHMTLKVISALSNVGKSNARKRPLKSLNDE